MFDFHEKRKIRSVLYSRTVIVFLCAIAVVLSFSAYNRYTVARDMEGKLNVKKAELEEMKSRAAAIEAKVRYLEDERGVEEELRNRFDVVREGEQAIIFIDDPEHKKEEDDLNVSTEENKEENSFIKKMIFW